MNKLIKKSPINFLIIFFIFFIIVGWFYFGWPRFFNFLPKIKDVKAAILVDSVSTNTGTGVQTVIVPHTTSGINRLMLVGISFNNDSYETVQSVTYNGVDMGSAVGTVTHSDDAYAAIYRLVAPDTGGHNVVVTLDDQLGPGRDIIVGVMTFTGVEQTTPLGTFVSNSDNSGGTADVTVTSAPRELVFSVIACEDDCRPIAVDNETVRWIEDPQGSGNQSEIGGGSTEAGAASVLMRWILGGIDHWALGAVPIKPAMSFTGTGFDVHGWAWNDNAGWISFISENCDPDGDGLSNGIGVCPTEGTPVGNYGVKIEDNFDWTGNLTGCAWSETIGWICFDPVDAPPLGESPNNTAKIDFVTKEISGWARICKDADNPDNCSGSNPEGWIKMRRDPVDPLPEYGVYLDAANAFHGYAYNDYYGWFSFTSKNCDPDSDGESNGVGECPPAGTPIGSYGVGLVTNVTGWAWSENYGWISFNCANPEVKECGNGFYGVNIFYVSSTFAGYAYSENLGWISFQESTVPDNDYTFSNNCEVPADCKAGSNCTACYNINSGQVYGWAKVLSMGDNGWINFNCEDTDICGTSNYNISIEEISGDFHDWAWGKGIDNVGVGWVSFNCTEGGPNGENVCGTSDYKVNYNEYIIYNKQPVAYDLDSPDLPNIEACNYSVRRAYLNWSFSDPDVGDTEGAYQIIFDDDPNPDFETENLLDTGKCRLGDPAPCLIDPGAGKYPIHNSIALDYGRHYYWWVRVWDNRNGLSEWADSTIDGIDGSDVSFTVPSHEFPDPYFIWFPEEPSVGEEVLFTSSILAKYYTGGWGTQTDCDDTCNWQWECVWPPTICNFIRPAPIPDQASSTVITFDSQDNIMKLTVTHDGYSCSTSTNFTALKYKLPSWIEIKQ